MSNANPLMQCPACGTVLTPDTPQGLCPKCLFASCDSVAETPTGLSLDQSGVSAALGAAWRALSAVGDDGHNDPTDEDCQFPVIPRVQIRRLIGVGGMGAVYEAEQQQPRRTVAVKVIRRGRANRRLIRRFRGEAEALGRLQHPGIAQIYEFGTTEPDGASDARPFFVMELIQGPGGDAAPTVTDFATRQNLSVRQRLELVAQVADAVHHAHQKGIIHRDLKPANILIAESGQPKVLDFGVARVTDSDIRATAATAATNAGQIIGTLPYMSPEQAGGDAAHLDTRSDVYALGVVCYELLAGHLPYQVGRMMLHEAVRVIREEEPTRLSAVDRTLKGDISTIVSAALAKEKERRYQSAAEMAADIRRYLRDEPLAARKASTLYHLTKLARRNKTLFGGIAAVFVALLVGIVCTAWQAVQASRAREDARQRLRDSYVAQARALRWSGRAGRRFDALELLAKAKAIRNGTDLQNEAIAALAFADLRRLREWDIPTVVVRFDRNARRYAYLHADGSIGVHRVTDDGLERTLADAGATCRAIRFSRDGRHVIALDERGAVRLWDLFAAGAPVLLLDEFACGIDADFLPDSPAVAVSDGKSLHVIGLRSADVRVVRLGDAPFKSMAFSPAGDYVSVVRAESNAEVVDVHDLRTGVRVARLKGESGVWQAAWEPLGDRIVTAGQDGKIRVWQWRDSALLTTIPGHASHVTSVAYSPDGTMIASTSWDFTLKLWDAESGAELARCNAGGNSLQFSDDASRIAFSAFGSDDRRKEVWEVTPALQRMLRGGQWDLEFSPDGSILAAAADGAIGLWDAARGRRAATLPAPPANLLHFAADGSALHAYGFNIDLLYAFGRDPATGVVGVARSDPASAPRDVVNRSALEWPVGKPLHVAQFLPSPDNAWVAAIVVDYPVGGDGSRAIAETSVWVWDRKTGRRVARFETSQKPGICFNPDGLSFAVCGERGVSFWKVGNWAQLFQTARDVEGGNVAFTPDGSVVAVPASTNLVLLLDTSTWKEIATLESPHRRHAGGIAFSRDGARLAVAYIDNVIHLWDLTAIRTELTRTGLGWDGGPYSVGTARPPQVKPVVIRLEGGTPGVQRLESDAVPARDPACSRAQIELSASYNFRLTQSVLPMPNDNPPNNLAELPAGLQLLGGTLFDVRGVVQLGSTPSVLNHYPSRIADVRVGRKCRRLHFLHGAAFQDNVGTPIGHYHVRYADGKGVSVPVVYGEDVLDWWQNNGNITGPRSKVAWRGGNPAARASGKGVILFKLTWENPRPEAEVVSIDFESAMKTSAPFLVGLTAELFDGAGD